MRSKLTTAIILVLLFISLFGQSTKSRAEFFKEFYGTLINSSGLEIPKYEKEVAPTVDLGDVIKQLESRYNIDIPAEEEAKFKTVEEVAEYVNLYLQQQSEQVKPENGSIVEPAVKPVKPPKEKKKRYSWKTKYFASYGSLEPGLLVGESVVHHGWNGNLADGFSNLFDNSYSWDAGIMWHQYGWTGKPDHSPNSFGFAYEQSNYNYWPQETSTYFSPPDSGEISPLDTTANRWSICMIIQQDITGRKKARPKAGLYLQEKIRVNVHNYGNYDSVISGKHISYGLGLVEGLYFLVFDLKFYQNIAYSPSLYTHLNTSIPGGVGLLSAFNYEIGLRLGISLKF